ncbi:MAG TPA: peptidylprolyl isomerase [Myxococcales bacterium]
MVRRFAATALLALALAACPRTGDGGAAAGGGQWMAKARAGTPLYATLQTNQGTMVALLYSKDAPKTVENFVGLATGEKEWKDPVSGQMNKRPLYDKTIFHRVIPGFMIQGGDPMGNGTGGPGYKFEDEFQSGKKFDKPCLLAMANSGPNTNGSQFFITEGQPAHLNNRHTIFGELVSGCDNVFKIARVESRGSRPVQPVVIEHIAISEQP